ncbi:hypothetical protein GGQ80_001364 [Sphingomonas jinjuensis]|uniref:Uncharacterized protein n=1 Tax=Sphingomonas jinjuensis TaxID=535907 RepID=A0A840FA11_9SPHN|nr:hypothetical protein [Sphingomonas jinjuensis]MBB4153462.1 hypothetical protein [Sphingomonas jinjuensis]
MLAGLLIAVHEADDRPGMLTATLPFGGTTLIEYQARLLIGAGVAQIVVLVSRLTPELLGALGRIGRRGVAVDAVRTAPEAAQKFHPLARIVMLADGLTTTDDVMEVIARDGRDALLVVPDDAMRPGYERVGGGMAWAGAARLDARRFGEAAEMPRDYDLQATLLMLASQAGAIHVLLPSDAERHGHAIGHSGAALEARGRTVLAAMVSTRRGWFDRLVVAPIARALVPVLVPRAVPPVAIAGGGAVVGVVGLATLAFDHPLIGLILALGATVALSLAAVFAELRDEGESARPFRHAAAILPGLAALVYGHAAARVSSEGGPLLAAVALIVIAVLGERAIGKVPRRRWWGSPPAYLLPLLLGAAAAMPIAGLVLAGGYATATASAAIERLRRQA